MIAKKAPNPTDKHVGARVRMRRMMLGMSQEKLGDALGLTFQQVQKYEKGTNRVSASRLTHIAKALKIPVSALISAESESSPEVGSEAGSDFEFLAQPGAIRLLRAFSRIENRELKRMVVDMAETLARSTTTPDESLAGA
jgi:transcriptional regulator with XRE-family HTH domain